MKMIQKLIPLVLLLSLSCQQPAYAFCAPANVSSKLAAGYQDVTELKSFNLADLGFSSPLILQGPYQEESASFTLPPDWGVLEPITLELTVKNEFQSLLQVFTDSDTNENNPHSQRGTLQIEMNGHVESEIILETDGDASYVMEIQPEHLKHDPEENIMSIRWIADEACQYSITSMVKIGATSSITFPVINQAVGLSLNVFPRPFYAPHYLEAYPVGLVIPDNADEDDLSALMAAAAGLGKQSDGEMPFKIFTFSELDASLLNTYHFIFIGKLNDLDKFIESKNGEISNVETQGQDNGILSLQQSPWNPGRALLLVSGETGAALRKAGAAIASSDFLAYATNNTAVILNLDDVSSQDQLQIDQPFSRLIQGEELQINKLGKTSITIPFTVPADTTISPEAYVEMYFRHSQLINYLQSSLTVSLNGTMVGNIRFSDSSAQNGLVRIIFPPNTIRPLKNTLELTFQIASQDICADERSGNYWISIFNDSYLHLPPTLEVDSEQRTYLFSDIPEVLLSDNNLSQLVFVAGQHDLQSWKYASKIAFSLGTFSTAAYLQPGAKFSDALEEVAQMRMVLIGKTGALTLSYPIQDYLPLPFDENGSPDEMSLNGIHFLIDPAHSYGILEITDMPSSGTILYSILGNSDQGLAMAFNTAMGSFFEPSAERGNLAIVEEESGLHYFYIEPKSTPANEEPATQPVWQQFFSNLSSGNMNSYLLIGSIVITILFALWMALSNRKKK